MKIWDKSVLYNILHAYANWGTRWSFRRFKVEGRENVPTEGPVILACNHCNSLMDAMVVLRVNRNLTAFGARADIFRNKKIAKVLTFLRIVPLARQRDSIREMKENLHTFDGSASMVDTETVSVCVTTTMSFTEASVTLPSMVTVFEQEENSSGKAARKR